MNKGTGSVVKGSNSVESVEIEVCSMRVRLIAGVALLVFGVATAQNTNPHAVGRGASTVENRNTVFDFEVVKRSSQDPVNVGRFYSKTVQRGNAPNSWEIRMGQIRELGFAANRVCEFTGAAVLTRVEGTVTRRIEGRVAVRVQDRRTPGRAGDPDTIRIVFSTPERANVFTFAGNVREGDIRVNPGR